MSDIKIGAGEIQGAGAVEPQTRIEKLATDLLASVPRIQVMPRPSEVESQLVSQLDHEVRTGLRGGQQAELENIVTALPADGKINGKHTVQKP